MNELSVGPKHIYRKIMMKIAEDKNLSSYITVFDVNWIDICRPVARDAFFIPVYVLKKKSNIAASSRIPSPQ